MGVIGLKPFGAGTTFGIKPQQITGKVDRRAPVLLKEMLQEPRISAVIPGVNIPEQLEQNVKGSYERDQPPHRGRRGDPRTMPAELPGPPDARLPVAAPLGIRLKRLAPLLLVVVAVAFGVAGVGAAPRGVHRGRLRPPPASLPPPRMPPDVLGANAACLVCHLTFVKEALARTPSAQGGVGCIEVPRPERRPRQRRAHRCDPARHHLSPPERSTAACANCHKGHDVPATKVIARFLERKLPTRPAAICTDCHGAHRIEKADGLPAAIPQS